MKIIHFIRKIVIHIRTSVKVISLVLIGLILILAAIVLIYKPIYSVTLDGEFVGYSKDKSALQAQINEYIKKGNEEQNLAFVKVENLPEYKMCLLKKDITTNDEEILAKVKQTGTDYYNYYTILQDGQEKLYVANYDEAQKVIQELQQKDSENKNSITMQEKYSTEIKEFAGVEQAVAQLYVEKKQVKSKVQLASNVTSRGGKRTTDTQAYTGKVSSSFIQPISGKITSRFNSISGVRSGAHTGLDIAAPNGTPIKAAANGRVTFAGRKGSYGNLIIVSHGDGTETWYGHCSSLVASAGQTVSQGQVIAKVGSTGNSTGYHLHLEIRINGTPVNPQRYLY